MIVIAIRKKAPSPAPWDLDFDAESDRLYGPQNTTKSSSIIPAKHTPDVKADIIQNLKLPETQGHPATEQAKQIIGEQAKLSSNLDVGPPPPPPPLSARTLEASIPHEAAFIHSNSDPVPNSRANTPPPQSSSEKVEKVTEVTAPSTTPKVQEEARPRTRAYSSQQKQKQRNSQAIDRSGSKSDSDQSQRSLRSGKIVQAMSIEKTQPRLPAVVEDISVSNNATTNGATTLKAKDVDVRMASPQPERSTDANHAAESPSENILKYLRFHSS